MLKKITLILYCIFSIFIFGNTAISQTIDCNALDENLFERTYQIPDIREVTNIFDNPNSDGYYVTGITLDDFFICQFNAEDQIVELKNISAGQNYEFLNLGNSKLLSNNKLIFYGSVRSSEEEIYSYIDDDDDGGGFYNVNNNTYQAAFILYDLNTESILWEQTFVKDENLVIHDVVETDDGKLVGLLEKEIIVMNSLDGISINEFTYDFSLNESFTHITTNDNFAYVTGLTRIGNRNKSKFSKIDLSNGSVIFSKFLDSEFNDHTYPIGIFNHNNSLFIFSKYDRIIVIQNADLNGTLQFENKYEYIGFGNYIDEVKKTANGFMALGSNYSTYIRVHFDYNGLEASTIRSNIGTGVYNTEELEINNYIYFVYQNYGSLNHIKNNSTLTPENCIATAEIPGTLKSDSLTYYDTLSLQLSLNSFDSDSLIDYNLSNAIVQGIIYECDFCSIEESCRVSDSLVLLDLYNSSAGLNWDLNQSIDNWQGITLNSNGCVSKIEIQNLTSAGTIPNSIGYLNYLEELNLQNCNFSGTIPLEIGYNKDLQMLNLSYNQFTGEIPIEITTLNNLTTINLSNNQFSGKIPSDLSKLTGLLDLNLSQNNLDGQLPYSFGSLIQLTSLQLNNNNLSGCYFSSLTALCNSNFTNSNISAGNNFDVSWSDFCTSNTGICSALESCRHDDSITLLTLNSVIGLNYNTNQSIDKFQGVLLNENGCVSTLYIAGYLEPNTAFPNELANLTYLDTLGFYTYLGNSEFPEIINTMTNLKKLDLIENGVIGNLSEEIDNLNNLEVLSVVYNSQLIEDFVFLDNLPNLRELTINTSLNPNSGFPNNLNNLSNLEILNISSNYNYGTVPLPDISNLVNLKHLSLNGNNLTGTIPNYFYGFTNLQTLNLNYNSLGGILSEYIGTLTNLKFLDVSSNSLIGHLPESLSNLTNLEYLYLDRNFLEGNIPSSYGNLTNLIRFYVYNNDLSGCYPSSISFLCNSIPSFQYDEIDYNNNFSATFSDFCDSGANTCSNTQINSCRYLDSLSLIDFYNLTTGLPWDLTQDIDTWQGVTLNAFGCVERLQLDGLLTSGTMTDPIDDTSPLSNLYSLVELDLEDCNITGTIPPSFGNLYYLEELDLEGNNITGSIPNSLSNLTNLNELVLIENQLSGCYSVFLVPLCLVTNQDNQISNSNNFDQPWSTFCINQTSNCFPDIGSCTYEDSLTLLSIEANFENLNWDTNLPISYWSGVTLNEDGCVEELNLNGYDYPNTYSNANFVPELGDFSAIELLQISYFDFGNSIPNELGNLSTLQTLKIRNNILYGNLPESISNLTNLENLSLAYNNLTGPIPSAYGSLVNLTCFETRNNNLSGCYPSEIAFFCDSLNPGEINYFIDGNNNFDAEFEDFCADGDGICTTYQTTDCSYLDSLTLISFYNSVSGLPWNINLPMNTWQGVVLNSNGCVERLQLDALISGGTIPEVLGDLTYLKELDLEDCNLTGTIPTTLGNLAFLDELDLEGNFLMGGIPSSLATLQNLEELVLIDNNLSNCYSTDLLPLCAVTNADNQISDGNNFNQLWSSFCYNQITSCQPDSGTCRYNDSLILLQIYNNFDNLSWDLNLSIDNWNGVYLNENGCVQQLSISGCQNEITGECEPKSNATFIPEIGDFTEIESLEIANFNFSNSIPNEISNLTTLSFLYISYNNLTGNLPQGISSLTNLNYLDLSSNDLSGSIPASYANLANLSNFIVANNNLSGCYPEEIAFFCDSLGSGALNYLISNGNNFAASFEDFCNNNIGNCTGCTDVLSCNFNAFAITDDGSCDYGNPSCSDPCNPVIGCTDVLACNYDANACVDDGSCNYGNSNCVDPCNPTFGCTDPSGCNYDATACVNDGTCIFGNVSCPIPCNSILGCTDALATNYNPNADCDNGSCIFILGCTDPTACSYNPNAVIDDGSCDFGYSFCADPCNPYLGCTDVTGCNYDATACLDDGSCFYPATALAFSCSDPCSAIIGCTTACATNYNPLATCDDGSCNIVLGCPNPAACNYDPTVCLNDGSCNFGNLACTDPCNPIMGCTNANAANFNASACVDDGTCQFQTCAANDSLTLLAIYNSISGFNWDLNQPISNWTGIVLNANGCVTELNYNYGQLNGVLPPEIGDLYELEILNLFSNDISGSIPSEIGNLANLVTFNIGNNDLTGALPAEIGNLNQLENIYLQNNDLSGLLPVEIGNLSQLLRFIIFNNNFAGPLPAEIGSLQNLFNLQIFSNQFSGCYENVLTNLCSSLSSFYSTNFYISDGNNFNVDWETFCNIGYGNCDFNFDFIHSNLNCSNVLNGSFEFFTTLNYNQFIGNQILLLGNGIVIDTLAVNSSITNSFNALINVPFSILNGGDLILSYESLAGNTLAVDVIAVGAIPNCTVLPCVTQGINTNLPICNPLSDGSIIVNIDITYSDFIGSDLDIFANGNYLKSIILNQNSNGLVNLDLTIPIYFYKYNNGDLVLNFEVPAASFCSNELTIFEGDIPYCPINSGICAQDDSIALLSYYHTTSGLNWDISNHVSSWDGITLNANGCVTEINNSSSGLSGFLPDELGILSELIELDVFNNNLTGSIPVELGNLANLQYLYLSNNLFSGSIPIELGNLSNLEHLALQSNNLSGNIPIELGNLSNLTQLQLSSNGLTGIIPNELGNLSNLTRLVLSNNDLTGSIPESLGNLSNLEWLYLYNNDLSGCFPPSLTNLCTSLNAGIDNNFNISFSNNFDVEWTIFCDYGYGTCIIGCTDNTACNYDVNAELDNGNCYYGSSACANPCNEFFGCTDMTACNYDSNACSDDGSCAFEVNGSCCDDIFLLITNPISSSEIHEAEIGLISDAVISNGTVQFTAGEYIQFLPGFEAESTANFTAEIGECQ